MNALLSMFACEDTLLPGAVRSDAVLSTAGVAVRPMASAQQAIGADGCAILPGGFAVAVPEEGRVITVAMDGGFLVHLERTAADADDEPGAVVTVTVEAPAEVEPPIDDARLARLAVECRERATGDDGVDKRAPSSRALRRAWSYRRTFERLAERFPGEGGPVVPVRWVTLSYEGRVHVPGIGTLDVDDGDDACRSYTAADGREVAVRRVGASDAWAPAGAVEVVVAAAARKPARDLDEVTDVMRAPPRRRTRVKTSPKVVPL